MIKKKKMGLDDNLSYGFCSLSCSNHFCRKDLYYLPLDCSLSRNQQSQAYKWPWWGKSYNICP